MPTGAKPQTMQSGRQRETLMTFVADKIVANVPSLPFSVSSGRSPTSCSSAGRWARTPRRGRWTERGSESRSRLSCSSCLKTTTESQPKGEGGMSVITQRGAPWVRPTHGWFVFAGGWPRCCVRCLVFACGPAYRSWLRQVIWV